jgi:hypothetical protein
LLIAGGLVACQRTKSYNPLSTTIAGPLPNVSMTPPQPIEPHNGKTVLDTEQPLVLVMANPTSSSPRPFGTEIQIATDEQFSNVVVARTGIGPGEDGLTRISMGDRLPTGRRYYWRGLANDGANTSGWSGPAMFEVVVPVVLGAPEPLTPIGNAQVTSVTPELRVRDGSASGPHGQLFYQFQIGRSSSFASLVADQEIAQTGSGTETRFTSPPLPQPDTPYFWRARLYDAKHVGPWSRVEVFRSPVAAAPPPGPAPGPAPGGPCNASSPSAIVACEREKYGFMSTSEIVAFLNAVASSLNRNGIADGPFGVLRKTSGNQCGGYSCDIICAGNGSAQKQWDVLVDADGAQRPTWSGPETVPHIRIDVCEIR